MNHNYRQEDIIEYDYIEGDEDLKGKNGAIDEAKKLNVAGIHSTGFKDFLLKPELQRAIVDCGFEHPSEGLSTTQLTIFSPARVHPEGYHRH